MEGPSVHRCELKVPDEVSGTDHCREAELLAGCEVLPELGAFVDSIKEHRVLTVALRGLAKFAQAASLRARAEIREMHVLITCVLQAASERKRLFTALQGLQPLWVVLPHGSLATTLLSVRPPAKCD